MEKGCEASSHSKTCHKTPGGKSPLAPARLGTGVSKMAGSFLLKPKGMAGLQRLFIKMNYEPMGLSGWIWPRLGGRGPAGPLPGRPETLFLSSQAPSHPAEYPLPLFNERERHLPLQGVSRTRGKLQPEKIVFLVSGRHLAGQAWPRPFVTVLGPLLSNPLWPQAIYKSTHPEEEEPWWGAASHSQELAVHSFPS